MFFLHFTVFPNVLGCIDGILIEIKGPSENEPDYVNKKEFHSLNVQVHVYDIFIYKKSTELIF